MRGLLIKDFALLKNQKRMFLVIIAVFLFYTTMGALDSTFILGYTPFIFCIFVMSSISYDEFDNGLSFLMVLPTTRKQYAAEKYVFGICMGIVGMLLAVFLTLILELKNHGTMGMEEKLPEVVFTAGWLLLFIGLFLGIMIPIQLRFGSEKGRIVMFGIFMAVVGLGYFCTKYVKNLPLDFNKLISVLTHAKPWELFPVLAAAAVVILLISYGISARIMIKKEF